MIKGVSGGDNSDFVSKARGWFKENVSGEEHQVDRADFGTTVATGAGIGAAVGTGLGLAKGIHDASNAEWQKVEHNNPIYSDKLKGYNQHAEGFNGKYSLTFSPKVGKEQVGEYTNVEYTQPKTSSLFLNGLAGMALGAIGGSMVAAVVKVIRDLILGKE